jgi:hypothetical protein
LIKGIVIDASHLQTDFYELRRAHKQLEIRIANLEEEKDPISLKAFEGKEHIKVEDII